MKVNITAGEELNNKLSKLFPNEEFVPFNEAMIKGDYHHEPFSENFMIERAAIHGVSVDSYKKTMGEFIEFIPRIHLCRSIVLWFGDEPFCKANTEVVLSFLKECGYKGKLDLNIVDENTCEILKTIMIQ